jgi:inorganic phosphate transporter, PiT family
MLTPMEKDGNTAVEHRVGVCLLPGVCVAWSKLAQKIALPLAASPLLAVVLGLAALALVRAVPGQAPLTPLLWLSRGAAGLARGLNNAPKIVALGSGFAVAPRHGAVLLWLLLAVAVTMGAGSWAGGRRVTQTVAERVSRLENREGLGANLATALVRSPSAPAPRRPGRSG